MAVDASGQAFTSDGTTWSAPQRVVPAANLAGGYALSSISCPATNFCGAVDAAGDGLTYDGHSWTLVAHALDLSGDTPTVSCASAQFCVTVLGRYAVVYNGATWSARTTIVDSEGGDLTSVSCPTAGFCAAADSDGNTVTYDGTNWTQQSGTFPDPESGAVVSCSSPQFCTAVDNGATVTFDGTGWSQPTPMPLQYPSALSCPVEGSCVAVAPTGDAATLADASWSVASQVDPETGLRSISCTSATACTAVDDFGDDVTMTNGVWAAPSVFDHVTGRLADISCPQVGFCTAVDAAGNAITLDGGGWSAPSTVDPTGQYDVVSCADDRLCAAGGFDAAETGQPVAAGVLSTERNGTWTTQHVARPVGLLSCPTDQFCLAIDTDDDVATYDGTGWSTWAPAALSNVASLSCTSATFCSTGNYTYNGKSWTFVQGSQNTTGTISCVSPTFCAAPDGLYMAVYNGRTWSLTGPAGAWGGGTAISCVSALFCGLPDVLWIDRAPTQPVDVNPTNSTQQIAISCPSITTCYQIDSSRAATWHTAITAPTITTQPANVVAVEHQPVPLRAAADGSPNMLVQWQTSTDRGAHWSDVDGATDTLLTVNAVGSAEYRAAFTDPAGAVRTAAALVSAAIRPAVTRQPANRVVRAGARTTVTAVASGLPAPTVAWQRSTDRGRSWTTMSDAHSSSYNVVVSRSVYYRAVFTNMAGHATTRSAAVTVAVRPHITRQPRSRHAATGHRVSLSARASGVPTPTVHWQRYRRGHWRWIRGATHRRLRVKASRSAARYRAVFRNVAGTAATWMAIVSS